MRFLGLLSLTTAFAALCGCAVFPGQAQLSPGATPQVAALPDGTSLRYMQFVPAAYHGGKAPLLIFLHGSGEAGGDVFKVMTNGPWNYAKAHAEFPFIVVAPQLLVDGEWNPEQLKAWLEDVEARLPVDRRRIYLTGLSRGGGGTWDFAMRYPDLFAAIAPVSGYSNLKQPCGLKGVGIWAFHGAKDDIVPIADEAALVDRARACGVDINYTIYPEGNHNAWDATYSDPTLYAWLLSHERP
ncbi:MAG: dienelactone hydrolase family protein [Alphaproteobacteria bacterium]|nr:dienelactone hydrolase family protein [Alphaproteobacteria bacterium]MDE2493918.1 dienelactone hydrolase family protein [Alphaproteobacteria bacterium]